MYPFHYRDLIDFGKDEVGEKLLWRRQEVAIGKQGQRYDENREAACLKKKRAMWGPM